MYLLYNFKLIKFGPLKNKNLKNTIKKTIRFLYKH